LATHTDPSTNGQTAQPPPPGVDAPRTPRLARLGDLRDDWRDFAQAAHDAFTTGAKRGPVTGLPSLDRELGNVLEPGTHILHGQPGTGKTALALQIASECGFPSLYVTAEMALLELLRRITARVTGTFLGRLKSGELAPADSLALVERTIAAVPYLAIADATLAYASPDWILAAAEKIKGDAPHILIVVDSVHSWSEANPDPYSEYDTLNAALSHLRTIAARLCCPVLGVAERNRDSMKKGGQSAAAGSRKFEYGASSVIDLTREEDAREDATGLIPVTLKLAKNRNGAAGKSIPLKFHGACQRFRES
jgi:replicative DNA helicase